MSAHASSAPSAGTSAAPTDAMSTAASRLRALIADARAAKRCITLPACHDALSAVLIARAGFQATFMSGFAVSATALALPDAGLISYGEQLSVGRNICEATRAQKLCVIGDGDTGFGGSGNVRRTMRGYASAGFAGISIEDQVFPKRCSYAKGLAVESREAAVARVRAAIAARDEMRSAEGLDLVLIARTDCRNAAAHGGLDEAIARCVAFAALGADVVYAEGLRGGDELRALAQAVPHTPIMLAQVERPGVPLISAEEAASHGCTLSLLGLTVLSVAMRAVKEALRAMAGGGHPSDAARLPFEELYKEAGFKEHYEWEERFEPGRAGGEAGGQAAKRPKLEQR